MLEPLVIDFQRFLLVIWLDAANVVRLLGTQVLHKFWKDDAQQERKRYIV